VLTAVYLQSARQYKQMYNSCAVNGHDSTPNKAETGSAAQPSFRLMDSECCTRLWS